LSEGKQAEVDRRDFVRWLAETQKHRSIAMPKRFPVQEEWLENEELRGAARFWSFAEIPLVYEPRSLVVSPDGEQVAVGTKSGDVHIARWDGREAAWRPHHVEAMVVRNGGETEEDSPGAIRGLLYLEPDVLVAGWSNGCFSVIERPASDKPKVQVILSPKEPRSSVDWYLGTQRISRLVPLFDPRKPPPAQGPLVLAILSRPAMCVLEKRGKSYSSSWRDRLGSAWNESMGDPVDAVWIGGALWLLTTCGTLFRCLADATGVIDLETSREVRTLRPPRPDAVFQRLAACEAGLSVLAAEAVTLLWFDGLDGLRPEAGEESWFPVPGALDCAVCFPYPGGKSDRVWTVVSTAQPGLRWVGWKKAADEDAGKSKDRPWPRSASGSFATPGGESILYLAFGGQGPHAPLYLACGTRDHKLLIASVLDLWKCEEELSIQIAWLIRDMGVPSARQLFQENAGLAWQCLMTQIRRGFRVPGPTATTKLRLEPSKLFPLVDKNDLLQLSIQLIQWHGGRQELDSELAKWVLPLLRRANELGPATAREVAEVLYDRLQRAWNKAGSKPGGLKLRSLANFLRKWVIHGHTYAEKETQLYQVFEHNRQCGRKLDALSYLTRLMRKRSDTLWETSFPAESWAPPVWGLVTDEAGTLCVTSLGDGSVCALDGDGNRLRWEARKGCSLEDLAFSEDLLRLQPSDARKFASQYRHGPYARSLWLRRLPQRNDEPPSYILVFCLKGWRQGDLRREIGRPPLIYALLLRRVDAESVGIERIASTRSHSELYGLCLLREEHSAGKLRCTLLCGTSGSWIQDKERQPMPFIELDVEVHGLQIGIRPRETRVQRFEKGERVVVGQAVVPEAANNRCWALAVSRNETGTCVWGGFQDGSIRGYRLQEDEGVWCEGGRLDAEARQRGLKATGPVWRLLPFQMDGKEMLAYGTGDGVVGAVSVEDMEASDPSDPFRFLLHLQGGAPICGLTKYTDNGQHYLLSVDQRGAVNLFDLNPAAWPEVEDGKERGYRFNFPGLRVDQFELGLDVRALAVVNRQGEIPQILVGTAEAGIHRIELRYPFYSQRRKDVPDDFQWLMEEEAGGRSVLSVLPPLYGAGSQPTAEAVTQQAHQWLRVLVLDDVSLMRFSLWNELRKAGEAILAAPLEADLGVPMKHYKTVLEDLEEETFRRRPFSEDLALALWEECAKIASCIARRILRMTSSTPPGAGGRVNRYLEHYHELNSRCTDLCNRWIGVDQSVQSIVLVDSFTALFDWTALTLIASDPPSGKKAQEVRDFLVYGLIQYRLSYPDTRVILETLRVINMAISRAVVNVEAGTVGPKLRFRVRPSLWKQGKDASGPDFRIGFYDIMAMVGDVWERLSESLSYSDPLTTEVTRFFSLTLLLLPDCALILGQVVSENRLMERGYGLVKLIVEQAGHLREELSLPVDEIEDGLGRFKAYISDKVDPAILGAGEDDLKNADPEEKPWLFLLNQARLRPDPGPGDSELSDASWLVEQRHVLLTIAWMEDLSRPSPFEESDEITQQGLAGTAEWLAGVGRPRFYRHSYEYLKKLNEIREGLRLQVGFRKPLPEEDSPQGGMRAIKDAIETCEERARELQTEHLFRPQRDHYQWVLGRWRDQLIKLAGEAVEVLDIMDRFNRHVYRRSADALMDNIINLSMQTAPISYLDRGGGTYFGQEAGKSLRTRILKRLESYPVIRGVFESGEYLVQNTHLAGALLTIARHYTGTPEDPSQWSTHDSVRVGDIENIVREVARRTGLLTEKRWASVPGDMEEEPVPGTKVVWDLIVQEWATNINRHSIPAVERPPLNLFLKLEVRQPSKERAAIRLSSNFPYVWSLGPDEQALYERDPKGFEESLENLFKLGARRNYDRPGAGMGLFMIRRLVGLWAGSGMEVRLILPRARGKDHELPPLCLEVSWHTGRH
jgi:hypothetical protein